MTPYKRPEGVSGPAVLGVILGCSLFVVCGVLLILAVVRRFRRDNKHVEPSKSRSTDFEISVLGEVLVHHPPPPTTAQRVQEYGQFSQWSTDAWDTMCMSGPDENNGVEDAPAQIAEIAARHEEKENICMFVQEDEQASVAPVLHFGVKYNFEKNALTITIQRFEYSRKVKGGMNVDPYIKIQLLPDKQHRAKTRVVRHANDDSHIYVYNEDFTFFGLTYNQLQRMIIHIGVISFDRYSRDTVIGELMAPIATLNLSQSDREELLAKEITLRSEGRVDNAEALVSLSWQPSTNRLTCVILKAKGLPRKNIMDLADPYMKLYLICNGQRIAKKKTHVKSHTLNPVFNESFIFDLPSSIRDLQGVSLEILLLDFDRLTKNEVIGRLELGAMTSAQDARSHWEQICDNPRRQIAEWHKFVN